MARKRPDNKKWKSRPSRKKSHRKKKITQKPCQIRINNSKLSRSTKPSQQRRRKILQKKNNSITELSLEEKTTEEMFDARIIHHFLSERYVDFLSHVVLNILTLSIPTFSCVLYEHEKNRKTSLCCVLSSKSAAFVI